MNTTLKGLLVGLTLMMGAGQGMAGYVGGATVSSVGVNEAGRVFVYINTTITQTGCNAARFDVASNSPGAKQILALVTSALISGKTINVATNGCIDTYPLVGAGAGGYIQVNP